MAQRIGFIKYSVAAVVAFVLWFWDEALFVAPVAALTAIVGPFYGWVAMTIIYFVLFFTLSIITLKAFRVKKTGKLGKWVEIQMKKAKKSRLYPLLQSGTFGAVIVSCFFLGGLITSHIVVRLKIWPGLSTVSTALVCNILFATIWVGFYSGVFGLIFHALRNAA